MLLCSTTSQCTRLIYRSKTSLKLGTMLIFPVFKRNNIDGTMFFACSLIVNRTRNFGTSKKLAKPSPRIKSNNVVQLNKRCTLKTLYIFLHPGVNKADDVNTFVHEGAIVCHLICNEMLRFFRVSTNSYKGYLENLAREKGIYRPCRLSRTRILHHRKEDTLVQKLL